MDAAILESAKQVLSSEQVEPNVVSLASSFYFQSQSSIPLKPTQEPARAHACAVLAVEHLRETMTLPPPNTRTPPLPPAQYRKLLQQFRTVLMPASGGSAPSTPRKTRERGARARAARSLQSGVEAFGGANEFDDSDSDFSDDSSEIEQTPRRRPPLGPPASASASPQVSPRRPRAARRSPTKTAGAPTTRQIEEIGQRMGLTDQAVEAVKFAFGKYRELVKDLWGLVYGLFVVVSERSDPRMGAQHERELIKSMRVVAPSVQVNAQEWIRWTQQIVAGQSWLMEIGAKEPQPVLAGAAGGWFQ